MEKEKKEYFCTKVSDRKENRYNYIKTLEIDEEGYPTEEELAKLIELEEDRYVSILIGDNEISVISFTSFYKMKAYLKKEYIEYLKNDKFKTIKLSDNIMENEKRRLQLLRMLYVTYYNVKNIKDDFLFEDMENKKSNKK